MFGNKKKRTIDSDDQNYEYKFRQNGTIIQKPTDVGYNYAKIKRKSILKNLEGTDNYNNFTTNDKQGNLIYKFHDNSNISDFNYTGNDRKEERAVKRAEKGRSRKGTAFTINDDKVADELYRAVAGNSDVEYGKLTYNDLSDNTDSRSNVKYDIWTEKTKGVYQAIKLLINFRQIILLISRIATHSDIVMIKKTSLITVCKSLLHKI